MGKSKVTAKIMLSSLLRTSVVQDNSSVSEHNFPVSFKANDERLVLPSEEGILVHCF